MEANAEIMMTLPIHQLKVSPEFIGQTEKFGFNCLNDIAAVGWGKLIHMEHFTYRWFNELVGLLNSNQLLYHLEYHKRLSLFPGRV